MDKNSTDLISFIESARAKNASDDSITKVLKEGGWGDKEIAESFGAVYERLTGKKIPSRTGSATHAESAKDAFVYLLSFSTLGSWTFALGSALFTFIDQAFPDAVFGSGYIPPSYSIATEMATMIVTFPIYFFVMRYIVRDLAAHPEKFDSPVRRWLTYLALFIAVAVAIGDLVTFLMYLLRGELTIHFMLKVITVLFISGGVVGYYLTWVKKRNA
jgi:hypothetical protein